jgi:hypothetical protein
MNREDWEMPVIPTTVSIIPTTDSVIPTTVSVIPASVSVIPDSIRDLRSPGEAPSSRQVDPLG